MRYAYFSMLLLFAALARAGEAAPAHGNPAPGELLVNDVFRVSERLNLWDDAQRRARLPLEATGGIAPRTDSMMMEGFLGGRGVSTEVYAGEGSTRELVLELSADDAIREDKKIKLSLLRICYYISPKSVEAVSQTMRSAGPPGSAPTAAAAIPISLPRGRVAITAQGGVIDMENAEGEATGGVVLEIYADDLPGDKLEPTGVLSCQRLRWRTWRNPTTGSSELVLFVLSEKEGEPDPLVRGRFLAFNADGSKNSIDIQAEGMVLETSTRDDPYPLQVNGQRVGTTTVERRRVVFRRNIQVVAEGMGSALIPFQQAQASATAAPEPAPATEEPAVPEARSRTEVHCNGPAVLDLAVLPHLIKTSDPNADVVLARRFEFLNGVKMLRRPLPGPDGKLPPDATHADLTCTHLCIQYPSGLAATMFPEYAEALGQVRIGGVKTPPAGTPLEKPRQPFRIDCQRIYFDGRTDAVTLEGIANNPLEIVDEMGELYTPKCVISRRDQMLSMPTWGKKRLVIRPGAMSLLSSKPPAEGEAPKTPKTPESPNPAGHILDLGAGELAIEWYGEFARKLYAPPGPPDQAVREKEILSLDGDVSIKQEARGLLIQGKRLSVERDASSGRLERMEGEGQVLVRLEDLQVKGEKLTAGLRYSPEGKLIENILSVKAAPGQQAMLWQGGSAIAGPEFAIDALNNRFRAYRGVVARVALPAPPTPTKPEEAAGGAALMPGLSLAGGGKLNFQCDGDLLFDGTSGLLKISKNVHVYQDQMRIVADELYLRLDQPKPKEKLAPKDAKAEGKKEENKDDKKDDKKDEKKKAETTGMFSGTPRSIECLGRLEVVTDSQVVQCDHVYFDMIDDQAFLKMNDREHWVQIYIKETNGGTKLLWAKHRLDYDGKLGAFRPAERILLTPYQGVVPLPRDAKPQDLRKRSAQP